MATPSAHAPLSVTEGVTSTYPELGKADRGLTDQAIVVGKEKENDEKETSEHDELRQKDAKDKHTHTRPIISQRQLECGRGCEHASVRLCDNSSGQC